MKSWSKFYFYSLKIIYFSSVEINRIGKAILGKKFLGVYPLDKIPYIYEGGLVVNTQTSTLPGEHWIAIFNSPNVIKVFDPFGFYYPSIVVNRVNAMGKQVEYNKTRYQDPLSMNCGQHCLLWLYTQTV